MSGSINWRRKNVKPETVDRLDEQLGILKEIQYAKYKNEKNEVPDGDITRLLQKNALEIIEDQINLLEELKEQLTQKPTVEGELLKHLANQYKNNLRFSDEEEKLANKILDKKRGPLPLTIKKLQKLAQESKNHEEYVQKINELLENGQPPVRPQEDTP